MYHYVIIKRPYDTFHNEEVQSIMGKAWQLKLKGYKSYYNHGVIPVCSIDFYASHILLLKDEQVVGGFKVITLQDCHEFKRDFPFVHCMLGANSFEHKELVTDIDTVLNSNLPSEVGYVGSLTLDPDLPKIEKENVYNMIVAAVSMFHVENKIPISINASSKKFSLYKKAEELGFKRMGDSFISEPLGNTEFYPMILTDGAWNHAFCVKYQGLWSRKTIYESNSDLDIKQAA